MASHDILMETKKIGSIMRVSAIDAETGTEVVFQVPSTLGQEGIRKLAVNKLSYVMKKEAEAKGKGR